MLDSTSIPRSRTAAPLLWISGQPGNIPDWLHQWEGCPFRLTSTGFGEPALQAFQTGRPRLVVLDVCHSSGGVDGLDTLRDLRAVDPEHEVPILFLTCQEEPEKVEDAFQAGATDFATRTTCPDLLRHRLRYLARTAGIASDLRDSQTRLTSAQRVARIGYWEWDLEREEIWCSEELQRMVGEAPKKAKTALEGFLRLVHPEDLERVRSTMMECLHQQKGYRIDHRILTPDGEVLAVEQDVQVFHDPQTGKPRAMGVVLDVTTRWVFQDQYQRIAYFDRVTGLPNRTQFVEKVAQWIDRAEQVDEGMAMIWLDLDHFVRVNDTMGHGSGDHLLRQLGERMQSGLREMQQHPDWVKPHGEVVEPALFHVGSDEFVAVLPQLTVPENFVLAVETLQERISEAMHIDGRELIITSSAGVSFFPQDGRDVETLMRKSGSAMNRVKRNGRNGYAVFKDEYLERASRFLAIESEMRKSIDEGQFLLHYQPKVNLLTGRVEGMEALVRWQHPDLGIVSPDDFIHVAEQCGLIVPLGRWVLKRALLDVARWNAEGKDPLQVSVNVSGAQLKEPGFAEVVTELIEETGVPVQQIELELTEGLLMTDADYSVRILTQLNELGVGVALDDFGTGYSSLSYLTRFPISTLKIDRSFVNNLTSHRGNAAIVSATIALAHSLRMHVVAEGVEERPELDFLRGLGCDSIQGYYFSRPLPADDFMAWVEEFHRQSSESGALSDERNKAA